jgi:hypothetical protein
VFPVKKGVNFYILSRSIISECHKDPGQKIEFFTYLVPHSIFITLINNIHLHPSTKFNCPNLHACKSEKEDRLGGGTAIMIKKEIKYSEVFLPKLQQMEPRLPNCT